MSPALAGAENVALGNVDGGRLSELWAHSLWVLAVPMARAASDHAELFHWAVFTQIYRA